MQPNWQPVKVSPCPEDRDNPYWKALAGRTIRVRPAAQGITVAGNPNMRVYEIHPEDFGGIPHVSYGRPFITEEQIQSSLWAKFKAWWREFRRPKCPYCGRSISKEESTCDDPKCIDMHNTARMGP
jgi:hypothetical protein